MAEERKGTRGKETSGAPANEVRVGTTTFVRTYLAYIARLFQEKHEKVIIRGMGYAIPKVVSLGMLVRKRFKGLHSITEVGTVEFSDEPDRRRGRPEPRGPRRVPLITITLSKKELDKNNCGYAPPLPDNEVQEYQPFVPGQKPRDGTAPAGPAEGYPTERRSRPRRSRRGGYGDYEERDYGYGYGYQGGYSRRGRRYNEEGYDRDYDRNYGAGYEARPSRRGRYQRKA